MSTGLQIEQIWRFPVKSLQGERLATASIDRFGVRGDRQWGVLDVETGLTLTARRCPPLLFAGARYHEDTDEVELVLPDGHTDLSGYLQREVRLVRAASGLKGRFEIASDFEQEDRSDWISWEGPTGTFHDSANVSLLSEKSISGWDVRRFRANLVTSGGGENSLVGSSVRIGMVEADVPRLIPRCVMVTRPQPGGIETDLDILRGINKEREGKLAIALRITNAGTVSEGDRVEVVAEEIIMETGTS